MAFMVPVALVYLAFLAATSSWSIIMAVAQAPNVLQYAGTTLQFLQSNPGLSKAYAGFTLNPTATALLSGPHTVFLPTDALIQTFSSALCNLVGHCRPFPVSEDCIDRNGSYEFCVRHHTLPGRRVTFADIVAAPNGQILETSAYYNDPNITVLAEPLRRAKSQMRLNYRNGVLTINTLPVNLTHGVVNTTNGIIYYAGMLVQGSYFNAMEYLSDPIVNNAVVDGMDNVMTISHDMFELAGFGDALRDPRVNGDKGLTILVPSNQAWWKLPPAELHRLQQPENIEELRTILLYHIIPEYISTYAMVDGELFWTSSWERTPSWDRATGGEPPKYGSWFPERTLAESLSNPGMFNIKVNKYGRNTVYPMLPQVVFEDHNHFQTSANSFYDSCTQNANILHVDVVFRPPEMRKYMEGMWHAGFTIPISKGPLAGTGALVYLSLLTVVCDDRFQLYATTIDLSNCTSQPAIGDLQDMYAKCMVSESVRHELGITLKGDHHPEAPGLGPTRDMEVHSHSIQMVLYSQMAVDYYNEVAEGSCAGPWHVGERRELDYSDAHAGCFRHAGILRESFADYTLACWTSGHAPTWSP
eukprot:jgi/Mesvir1/4327/Mv20971-RA.1